MNERAPAGSWGIWKNRLPLRAAIMQVCVQGRGLVGLFIRRIREKENPEP